MTRATMLIEFVPLLNLMALIVLLVLSQRWTGPSQAARLAAIEAQAARDRHRIGVLEQQSSQFMKENFETEAAILRELKTLSANVAEASLVANRVTILESDHADMEQDVQFLKDLGCGYPGCPRMKRMEEDGEKGSA